MVDGTGRVVVPHVVGLPFHVGRDVASAAGVVLANPDPDGPPIGALAWPGLYDITRPDPMAGTELHQWDSVTIEIVEHGDGHDRESLTPAPSPPADAVHASVEPYEGHD